MAAMRSGETSKPAMTSVRPAVSPAAMARSGRFGPVPMHGVDVGVLLEQRSDLGLLGLRVGVEADELRDHLSAERARQPLTALFERDVGLLLTGTEDLGSAERR